MNRITWILAAAATLTACGDAGSSSSAAGGISQHESAQQVDSPTATISAALAVTPINLDDAFGRTPPTMIEPGPCPFLSDETAIATARVHTNQTLLRQRVSNTECIWAFNRGFSVAVRLAPIDQAKPLSERRYNMGSDPVLEQQDGPGANAAILFDTTWDKKRPYGFGFEAEGQSVLIKVTGMSTKPEQLRATANEIASKLPSAPSIEPQFREAKPALDLCTLWSQQGLSSLFAYPAESTISTSGYGSGCGYKYYATESRPELKVSVQFSQLKESLMDQHLSDGARKISSYELPVVERILTDQFGTYTRLTAFIGNDEMTVDVFTKDGERKEQARKLFDNLMARIER